MFPARGLVKLESATASEAQGAWTLRCLPVSGALAPSYQPPPTTTGTTTIRAMHGDFSRVRAAHALAPLGKHIAPLRTATLSPPPVRRTPTTEPQARVQQPAESRCPQPGAL